MFLPSLSAQTGHLLTLEMTPLQIRRMRLNRASQADVQWIRDTVNTISRAPRDGDRTRHIALEAKPCPKYLNSFAWNTEPFIPRW